MQQFYKGTISSHASALQRHHIITRISSTKAPCCHMHQFYKSTISSHASALHRHHVVTCSSSTKAPSCHMQQFWYKITACQSIMFYQQQVLHCQDHPFRQHLIWGTLGLLKHSKTTRGVDRYGTGTNPSIFGLGYTIPSVSPIIWGVQSSRLCST